MIQVLCNECAIRVQLSLSAQDLVQIEDSTTMGPCEGCRKRIYSREYKLVAKRMTPGEWDGKENGMVIYMKDGTQEHIFTPRSPNEYARIIEERLGADFLRIMREHAVMRANFREVPHADI